MARSLKYVAGVLVVLLVTFVAAGLLLGRGVETRLERVYEVAVQGMVVPSDPASIERGRHLVNAVLFCEECHGEDLGGKLQFNDPLTGRISAKNLTAGEGGVGSELSDTGWVLAIRHGLDDQGKPLIEMPAEAFYYLSDDDLGSVIAYLKSLPPVDNELPERRLGPFYQLSILSNPNLIPAEVIDHTAPRPAAPELGISVEYGKYLTTACSICHGPDLSGGPAAGAGLDLTGDGHLSKWTEAEFIHALRTGETPRGELLETRLMPWERVGMMSDDELRAIWLYLQTLQ